MTDIRRARVVAIEPVPNSPVLGLTQKRIELPDMPTMPTPPATPQDPYSEASRLEWDAFYRALNDVADVCLEIAIGLGMGPAPEGRERLDSLEHLARRVDYLLFEERQNFPPSARGVVKAAIPASLRWQVWERDNFTCQHCCARRNLAVDHIHPESKGGELTLDNLQTLCRSCNSRKGTK